MGDNKTQKEEWNYDRIVTAQAQIFSVHTDMMRALHRGQLSREVRNRMTQNLRNAADDLDRMEVR